MEVSFLVPTAHGRFVADTHWVRGLKGPTASLQVLKESVLMLLGKKSSRNVVTADWDIRPNSS